MPRSDRAQALHGPSPFLFGILMVLALAALALLARYFRPDFFLHGGLADALLPQGAAGAALYIAGTAVLTPLGMPRQGLAALGGYVFGLYQGVLFASIGLTLGCVLGFFCARGLMRERLHARWGERMRGLERSLSRAPFALTLAIRLMPVGNNALTILAAGACGMAAPAFIAGSALGFVPQTVAFALLGSGSVLSPEWSAVFAVLLFLAACALGAVIWRRCRQRDDMAGGPAAGADA